MANLKQVTYDAGRKIEVGKTYTGNNGAVFTVTSIWSDKYADMVSYRLADGQRGDTPPNSMYYWIDWSMKVAA